MPGSRMIRATWSRPIPVHPCASSWACIFLYPYTVMKKSEWICMMPPSQSLVTRGRAAYRSFPEPSVAAWRDEPAVQGCGQDPADRPDPETIPILVDVRGHQGRVGSSLAAKKADAVVRMSFALRGSATSLRRRLGSSSVA